MINAVEEAITNLRHIQLDSEFPPADIVHMILAGGVSQSIYNVNKGVHQSAVEFLCCETRDFPNYPIHGGVVKEDPNGRPYFAPGTPSFRGNHRQNEFLGSLALTGIHLDSTGIVTERGTHATLRDMADAAMEVYSGFPREPGWSLILFSVHPGVVREWKNEQGELFSVEKILSAAVKRDYGTGSCFGTHAIGGIAFAISRFCLDQDVEPGALSGVWQEAHDYVLGAISLMQRNQKDDGSIDRSWFKSKTFPRTSNEISEQIKDIASRRFRPGKAIIYPTGHCLDAVSSLAMFPEFDRTWVDPACYITAHTIQSRWLELATGISALSHAVHALKLLCD